MECAQSKDAIRRRFFLTAIRHHVRSTLLALAMLGGVQTCIAHDSMQLLVGNYAKVLEFTIDFPNAEPKLTATTKVPRGLPWPTQFAATRRARDERVSGRELNIPGPALPSTAKWVEQSPDCSHVLVGFEHPHFDVTRTLAYGQSTPWIQAGELKLLDFNFVLDVAWSPSSRYLVIVETEERYSKSPLALLSGMAGHPLPLETLYLVTIDMQTNKKLRRKFLTDFPSATVALSSSPVVCQPR